MSKTILPPSADRQPALYIPPPFARIGPDGERIRKPRIYLGEPVAVYDYADARGRVLLQKRRFAPPYEAQDTKAFRMYARRREGYAWVWPRDLKDKYPYAAEYFDALLYRLPALLDATADDGPIWWTAGEKDADAVAALGVTAVTHWQGESVGASSRQAEHFRGWRGGVYLVADRDSTGAFDVVRRFDLLRSVGVPARHIRIVVSAVEGKGADAFDHLAAGRGLADFIGVSEERAREIAATSTVLRRSRDGYGFGGAR
jgi:hypothetical protein